MDGTAIQDLLKDQYVVGGYLLNIIKNTDSKGATNITVEYLKKRLCRLEELWKEVKDNNKLLTWQKEQLKDNAYFKYEQFEIYEDFYLTAELELERRMTNLLAR